MAKHLPPRQDLAQQRAQELRLDLTPAERLLWSILRAKRLDGLKFRRQVAIGPYIADFYCHDRSLVVELDGDSHDVRVNHDVERTKYMQSLKLRVIRFSNDEVVSNLEGVGVAILRAMNVDLRQWLDGASHRPPLPNPLPRCGGEGTRQKAKSPCPPASP